MQPSDFRGWLRLGELAAAEGTDAARTRAVDIWTKGLESVGHCEIDLVLPLSAALIQLQAVCRRGGEAPPARPRRPAAERTGTQPRRARRHAAARGGRRGQGKSSWRPPRCFATNCTPRATARPAPFIARHLPTPGCNWATTTPICDLDDQAADAYESAGRLDPDVAAVACESGPRRRSAAAGPARPSQHYRELAEHESERRRPTGSRSRGRAFSTRSPSPPPNATGTTSAKPSKRPSKTRPTASRSTCSRPTTAAAEGQLDQAVKVLEQGAGARCPNAWELWQALAVIQERRKDDAGVKKALAGFEKSRRQPRIGRRCSSRASPWRPADSTSRGAILVAALPPSCPTRANRSSTTQLVEFDLRQGNRADARRRLEESAARDPNNLQILDSLAQILADDRDWKALEDVEKQLEENRRRRGDAVAGVPRAAALGPIDRARRSPVPRGRAARARNRQSAAHLAAALCPAGHARPQAEPDWTRRSPPTSRPSAWATAASASRKS